MAALRAEGGIRALRISHVAHPTHAYATPSGKVELYSERAASLGLPPLPVHEPSPASAHPLTFRQGRTLTQFHASTTTAARCRRWLASTPSRVSGSRRRMPRLAVSSDGAPIRVFNGQGEFTARAHVTARVPAGTVWMRDGWAGLNS